MRKQHKRANLDKICNELIKTINFENTSKENLHDRTSELIIQGKIVKKTYRNDDSHRVNESIANFNIEQLKYSSLPTLNLSFVTPNTKLSSSIESVNTLGKPISNTPETPSLPEKDIDS